MENPYQTWKIHFPRMENHFIKSIIIFQIWKIHSKYGKCIRGNPFIIFQTWKIYSKRGKCIRVIPIIIFHTRNIYLWKLLELSGKSIFENYYNFPNIKCLWGLISLECLLSIWLYFSLTPIPDRDNPYVVRFLSPSWARICNFFLPDASYNASNMQLFLPDASYNASK